MDKDQLGVALQRGGVRPVDRIKVEGSEVFVADGFLLPPHDNLERFGVKPGDYPAGVYMTVWWTEDKPKRGGAAFFEPNHDPLLMHSYKQQARINSVTKIAAWDIRKMKANARH